MTDVRQTTATLVLGEELEGRFFVRTAAQELVVELYKPRGRSVELAVEAGHLRRARRARQGRAGGEDRRRRRRARACSTRAQFGVAADRADAGARRRAGRRASRSPDAIGSS